MRRRSRRLLLVAGAVVALAAGTALTAANTVPQTNADESASAVGPNDLKPSECAGITVNALVIGSGLIAGSGGNDLIIGGAGLDTITGLGGTDCVVAGGGNDVIDGGLGTDVCIGGPGTDTFVTLIVIPTCETAIQ
jgi:Ca2+-binding RTX toxin-like protein